MDYDSLASDPRYNQDPKRFFAPKNKTSTALEKACVVNLKFGPVRG